MAEAVARTSGREPLAGEPACDDIDAGSVSANCSDVSVDGDAGESLAEEILSELDELAEPGVLKPGEVEPVGQESAAIKESADTECHKPL
jgi:hypothetical protein